ncbi:hypothetical protein QC764_0075820 [Podospora pseudoanserina]|uniref:Uncharacterized protein n=1 Tax=Podospora pseudoanserina TaxID=2609844 RepID=A0ABR0I4F5_9PEZI|nr:hypothetical protein QC764_0075820 [Podospora pseudoanserina]
METSNYTRDSGPPKNCDTVPRSLFFRIFAFSYSAALRYHTVQPMHCIQLNQNYREAKHDVIAALARFRKTKSEELRFVQGAAALSGAAVIGVFSWPSTERTVWIAKMLWNWSLFLSFFALISSAHQRLLRLLPKDPSDELSEADLARCLSLFLQPPVPPGKGDRMFQRGISRRMVWFWQCPTMLMSFSWVLFLVGYTLHLLTPVFDASLAEFNTVVSLYFMLDPHGSRVLSYRHIACHRYRVWLHICGCQLLFLCRAVSEAHFEGQPWDY